MKGKFKARLAWVLSTGILFTLAACSSFPHMEAASGQVVSESQPGKSPVVTEKITPAVQKIINLDEIAAVLIDLRTSREKSYLAGNGWRHVTRKIVETSGDLRGSEMEWWIHTDQATLCPEVLLTIFDQDGKPAESNLVLSQSSRLADEIQPDSGAGSDTTNYIEVNEQSCAGSPEIALDDIEQSIQKPDLILKTTFEATLSQEELILTTVNTDAIKHQRIFTMDRATGFLISERDVISNIKDGSSIGTILAVYSYESVTSLPQAIRSEFSRGLAEINH